MENIRERIDTIETIIAMCEDIGEKELYESALARLGELEAELEELNDKEAQLRQKKKQLK